MKDQRAQILLVEDNTADVRLMREALRQSSIADIFQVAGNGDDALAVLQANVGDSVSPEIDLVLLDLNLPRKGGLEVLKEMRRDDRLKAMPVLILTTSTSELDVLEAYRRGANCYITKPVDFEQFQQVVSAIESFWFGIVTMPRRAAGCQGTTSRRDWR